MRLLALTLATLLAGCGSDHVVGETKNDDDNDGYQTPTDCDDTHADTNPDAPELCDGRDNDCDGEIDENVATPLIFYADADGDGFGDGAVAAEGCVAPEGYVDNADDCNDGVAEVSPDADELCNGIDDNCDGATDESEAADAPIWWLDADEDGHGGSAESTQACAAPEGYTAENDDCNDNDGRYYPGAPEADCADPADYNCDGSSGYADADGDGYAACEDCDDASASRNPGAAEVCDAANVDEDCDLAADDADGSVSAASKSEYRRDNDGDGYADAATTATVQCDAPAGFVAATGDCDDANSAVSPAATEVCDAFDADEDCDGAADDNDASVDTTTYSTSFQDDDGDGFGDDAATYDACDAPVGFVDVPGDCDDGNAAINPGASEVCDAADLDEDCNGMADDDDASVTGADWYTDADGDGFGEESSLVVVCDPPADTVSFGGDCDDTDASIHPLAAEVCDGSTDEDCDGRVDDADDDTTGTLSWYRDADTDGYGSTVSSMACEQPAGFVATGGDCADANASVHPGAAEVCDEVGTDEDCDGAIDDADASATGQSAWFADTDADGYGNPAISTSACDAISGYVANDDDCNDTSASISPAASEVCDAANVDEDCDGLADDADSAATGKSTFYDDDDADGYGDPAESLSRCDMPAGYAANALDCNDTSAAISPADPEICDSADVDEDCDGLADDADSSTSGKSTWYADRDGDLHGDPAVSQSGCSAPADYVADSTDCDDSDNTVNPDETEVCTDFVDNDCDGVVDCGAYEGDYQANDGRFAGNYTQYYSATAGDALGESLTSGDWDGDGVAEIAVLSEDNDLYGTNYGAVFFVEGPFATGAQLAASAAVRTYGGSSSSTRITELEAIPDIDGDGDDEILFWYSGSTTAYFHKGPLSTTGTINAGYASAPSGTNGSGAGDFLSSSATTNNWATGLRSANAYYGAVYLYAGTTTSTNFKGEAYLDYFGESIAGGQGNDVDGDGFDDLFIGAPQEDSIGTAAGAVYIITGSTTHSGTISASTGADNKLTGAAAGDQFGFHVALAGDADLDGDADVLVAGPYNDSLGSSSGALYLYTSPLADSGTGDAEATFYGTAANDVLGYDQPTMCDVDGDGVQDLLANARFGDGVSTNDGQVWLFYGPLSGSYDLADSADYSAMMYGVATGDAFGNRVVRVADTDADGDDEFAISAYAYDDSASSLLSGAVFVYPGQ